MPLETGQDYYNYYSGMMPWGNQGTTAPGTGITKLATPELNIHLIFIKPLLMMDLKLHLLL
jgi:hypothetical protein